MTSYDEWYNKWMGSNLSTACVIRVTNLCNERCRHCCFRSGPECVGQMSVKMCEQINAWVPDKIYLNIMGGEVTVLDNYPELLVALARGRKNIRVVTNGFWVDKGTDKFLGAIERVKTVCKRIDITVSQDKWHNRNSDLTAMILKNIPKLIFDIGTDNIHNIIPVGRAWDNRLVPNPDNYVSCQTIPSLLIDENGMIGRCPFGYLPWKHFTETTWDEAQNYIWSWRSEKISEGMNCHMCMEIVSAARNREEINSDV